MARHGLLVRLRCVAWMPSPATTVVVCDPASSLVVMEDELAFGEIYDAETLAALDSYQPPDHGPDPLSSRMVRWSRTSAVGAMAAGFAFGLREVLEPPRDEAIVIEVDADGQPHDLPIRLILDPDDPSGSLCNIRRDPPPPIT